MTTTVTAEPLAALTCPDAPHTHPAEEVGPLVGCSPLTLKKNARPSAGRNQIPSTKVGREVRFSHADIEEILARGKRRAAPPRRDSRRHS